jgi:hypothetical protein
MARRRRNAALTIQLHLLIAKVTLVASAQLLRVPHKNRSMTWHCHTERKGQEMQLTSHIVILAGSPKERGTAFKAGAPH